MRFEGRVAIVTGAARGIGRAIADRLASEGARVLIADIDEAAANAAAAELGEMGAAYPLDVTSDDSWQAAAQAANNLLGPVDILVNNAGIAGRSAPTWDLSVDEWQQVVDIDLTGVFLGCRDVLPGMIDRGYGRIVNIA
jgi:3-oxoacyl-[acyl-carrier protein] reductase